jgi:Tfp pilus assembly protein PilN
MRAVNLIPQERRGARRRSSDRSTFREPLLPLSIAVAAVVAAGVGFAAHSASSTVAARNAAIRDLDGQLAKLAADRQQSSGSGTASASQLSVVTGLVQQRPNWDGFLGTLSRVVPEDVWLLSLSAQEPTTGAAPSSTTTPAPAAGSTSSVTFTGYTYSQPSVARMMRRLDLVPWLQNVNLVSSTKTAIDNRKVFQFTLGANFNPLPQVAT